MPISVITTAANYYNAIVGNNSEPNNNNRRDVGKKLGDGSSIAVLIISTIATVLISSFAVSLMGKMLRRERRRLESYPDITCGGKIVPKPYSVLFHPYLSLKQKLISVLVSRRVRFDKLGRCEVGTEEAKKETERIRKLFRAGECGPKSNNVKSVNEWSKVTKENCPIAESTGTVPFRKNILEEWNIADRKSDKDDAFLNKVDAMVDQTREVEILVRFPSSLLPNDLRNDCKVLDYSGCLSVDFDKIQNVNEFFPEDVPIMIQFHGGGMTIGQANSPPFSRETAKIVEIAGGSDIITISVEYGLAPEHPFPIAIMEGLSVVDYIIASSERNIHVTGLSAGGNLALVVGLETFRKYPGRVASIQSQSPFLLPSCDTLSFYMNQNTFLDVGWLRWCWKAYFGLEKSDNNEKNCDNERKQTPLEKALSQNSNRKSWEKWKLNHTKAIHRLADPSCDVPIGLLSDTHTAAPKILIRTNSGDPLEDAGVTIVNLMTNGKTIKNLQHFKFRGLHCDWGVPYDKDEDHHYHFVWSENVFG